MSTFDLSDARACLPEVQEHTRQLVAIRADLAEARYALQHGGSALAEVKALEARLSDLIDWYPQRGIQVKGIAPVILDFPAVLDGQQTLLCWLEGEQALGWYHSPELGFPGRRPLS